MVRLGAREQNHEPNQLAQALRPKEGFMQDVH